MECENTSNESPDTVIPFPPSLPRPPFNLLAAILNGHAQDGSGSVARALVHLVVEAVVFVAVVDVEDLTCAGYIAGNATIYGDSVCVCVWCVCGVCGVCACVCVCVCVCVVCTSIWDISSVHQPLWTMFLLSINPPSSSAPDQRELVYIVIRA